MRKEERYCLLSYLRYTSLEKVLIFCVAESGDDDAFTSLIPGNLFLHNEDGRYLLSVIAAVGHPRVPREDAGRAEDASEHEIRSARAGVVAAVSLLGLTITIAALLALASASESDHKVRCSRPDHTDI